MNTIRTLITVFVLLLVVAAAAGWVWTADHQPSAQAIASHLVLAVSALAAVVGVVAIWKRGAGHDAP